VAALAAAGLFLLSGCGGSNSTGDGSTPAATVNATVKVNYTRIPLVLDANGVPTGLDSNPANFKTLPARGVQVRLWQGSDQTNPDGTKTRVWLLAQQGLCDTTGTVLFNAPKDLDVFFEVLSTTSAGNASGTSIIADPDGINSGLPIGERRFYALRKGFDGSAPAGNPVPGTKATAAATITFDVGLSDKWWLTIPSQGQVAQATLEPTGTGSRVLAILDSIYACYASNIGLINPGDTLDLHYRMGVGEARGSFIEYERTKYPLSFDTSTQAFHYFGSIRGATANDDAFDEGIIFPMMFRNGLWSRGVRATATSDPGITGGVSTSGLTGKALPDLVPETALLEGLPFAMAATLLKSPFLADTTAASTVNSDVRSLGTFTSGSKSGPAIAALAWDMTLKANSLPNPGTPTDWAKIAATATTRFYGILSPADLTDRPNIFLQLARLKEAKSALEPVDLATIFTDAAITSLAAPYNIVWPRPTTGTEAAFVTSWGADPNSLAAPLPAMILSMSQATTVNGTYPNTSSGEVAYNRFTLSKDTAYSFNVTTLPATLPAGTQVEVQFVSSTETIPNRTYVFSGTGPSPARIVLAGNKDTPIVYLARVRLLSPTTLAPDITATVSLDLAN
jgi:hypothetical protein